MSNDIAKQNAAKTVKYTQIVNYIEDLIHSGDLKAGDQLLSERELCERFSVSRSSVRKALAVLEGASLIETQPRGGAFVTKLDIQTSLEPALQRLPNDFKKVEYVYEVRQVIEVQAVGFAAERRKASDLRQLWLMHEEITEDIEQKKNADKSDTALHMKIVQAAHNPLLSEVMMGIVNLMMEGFAPARQKALTDKEVSDNFILGHEKIIQAIENKDVEEAREKMKAHLEDALFYVSSIKDSILD